MSLRNSLVLVGIVGLFLATATPATAQCQAGGCDFGPCPYSNLLYDHHFGSPTCGAWAFTGYVSRLWEASTCSAGFSGYQAVFYGLADSGASGAVFQDIEIPSTQSSAEVGFYLDIQGSSPSWWDRLVVTLRDPSSNQVLENLVTVTGTSTSLDCQLVTANVSGNYAGQTIRLHFESAIWTGASTRFVIDEVAYWHFF